MENFGPYLIFLVPVAFALCIVTVLIAVFQDAKEQGRGRAMRNAFFYVMSFLSLMVMAGSIVSLGYLGLRTWVFTDAQYQGYVATPVDLYDTVRTDASTELPTGFPACAADTQTCPLTDNQKIAVENWATDYQRWQNQMQLGNRRDVINAVSLLAVSLPLFVFFFLLIHRSRHGEKPSNVRPVYFYGTSFVTLAVMVIGVGLLINVGLKSWLLPPDAERWQYAYSTKVAGQEDNVPNMSSCVSVCKMPADYVTLAEKWRQDMDAANEKQKTINPYDGTFASSLPLIVVAIPLFAYHFSLARKEAKHED